MRKNYIADAQRIGSSIAAYESKNKTLPGISSSGARETLIEQIIDSEQRVKYTDRLDNMQLDPSAVDPTSDGFHPLKASILHRRSGNYDEAVWLVYLYVHFGRHRRAGWRYVRDTYGALGSDRSDWWTWDRISEEPFAFRLWLDKNKNEFGRAPGQHGFGNHRKYESLDAMGDRGTGAAVTSYVEWVLSAADGHNERFAVLKEQSPEETFQAIYRSLRSVVRFGRIAKFDYTTMIGRLKLVDVKPPHTYLTGATGPRSGAALLLRGNPDAGTPTELQAELSRICTAINVAPDVMEDAICNWQKDPENYIRFSA
ncbi:hypothetical protein [Tersicoccus sp. Bi-70]|uniref:alpha-glutamyl/putrescinyl thymine pyrophosphorylase clade 3 protein n=1 Tax=Tersicoccus sp. Bi-70 TaxID=1897634 RepID=UPI0009762D85|nr:hypothetical protein [Tersicoccus sp. Bi-70]